MSNSDLVQVIRNCIYCGRFMSANKYCANEHNDESIERVSVEGMAQQDEWEYQQIVDSVRDHPRYCECLVCVSF